MGNNMSIVKIIIPFIYCLLVGTALGVVFKKKYIDSLAPAFFVQILLMLLTGMAIGKLSVGIWIGIAAAFVAIAYVCIREKSVASLIRIYYDSEKKIDIGVCLFVFFYFVIFVFNAGKHFNMSGEFSQWGWFVREAYNNDSLYCFSAKMFEHKEYVPGVSLFEVLWCRLSLKYSEPNAYRGIQMLQTAMLLPVVTGLAAKTSEIIERKKNRIVMFVVNLFIIFAMPLFSSVPFYHTLYKDLILGVMVFYCIWITLTEDFGGYSLLVLGLSLVNISICKNTGIAFVPALFLLYAMWHHLFAEIKVSRIRIWLSTLIVAIISMIPWYVYKAYLAVNDISEAIKYQNDIREVYWKAIAMNGIIGKVSYFWIVVALAVVFVIFLLIEENKDNRKKIGLIASWTVIFGVYYAIVMYFAYMNFIAESDAIEIAGLGRYLSTYVLAAFYVVVATYTYYLSVGRNVAPYFAAIFLAENVAIFFGAGQMLPGVLANDEIWYEGHIEYLNNTLPEGADLLFVSASADVNAAERVQFYCENIEITEGIFASKAEEDNEFSVESFAMECKEHDYIYFFSYDVDFVGKYSGAFESSDVIAPGKLYQVETVNGKIRTSPVG